ncbi:MAG: hypothetical protein R2806_02340 [Saprospiraceae bacterium]
MSQPASLRPRILSALVFGVLLIGCLWIDTWSWRVLLCFFAVVLLYELSAFFWKGIADRTGQRIAIGVWSLVFMAWITDLIPFFCVESDGGILDHCPDHFTSLPDGGLGARLISCTDAFIYNGATLPVG